MLVIVDINVMWQAFAGKGSVSREMLNLIVSRKLTLTLSEAVFLKYEDVLKRRFSLSYFHLTAQQVDTILDLVLAVSVWQEIDYQFWPNLQDAADNMLVELAIISGAHYIVTNNIDDFSLRPELHVEGLNIVTPMQFFHIWSQNDE